MNPIDEVLRRKAAERALRPRDGAAGPPVESCEVAPDLVADAARDPVSTTPPGVSPAPTSPRPSPPRRPDRWPSPTSPSSPPDTAAETPARAGADGATAPTGAAAAPPSDPSPGGLGTHPPGPAAADPTPPDPRPTRAATGTPIPPPPNRPVPKTATAIPPPPNRPVRPPSRPPPPPPQRPGPKATPPGPAPQPSPEGAEAPGARTGEEGADHLALDLRDDDGCGGNRAAGDAFLPSGAPTPLPPAPFTAPVELPSSVAEWRGRFPWLTSLSPEWLDKLVPDNDPDATLTPDGRRAALTRMTVGFFNPVVADDADLARAGLAVLDALEGYADRLVTLPGGDWQLWAALVSPPASPPPAPSTPAGSADAGTGPGPGRLDFRTLPLPPRLGGTFGRKVPAGRRTEAKLAKEARARAWDGVVAALVAVLDGPDAEGWRRQVVAEAGHPPEAADVLRDYQVVLALRALDDLPAGFWNTYGTYDPESLVRSVGHRLPGFTCPEKRSAAEDDVRTGRLQEGWLLPASDLERLPAPAGWREQTREILLGVLRT